MNDLKNNSNNLPSVLQCTFNAKCFIIKEIYLLIGNCIGDVEIFNWFEEKKIFNISMFNNNNKSIINIENTQQIINISFFDDNNNNNVFLIQSRGGDLFFVKIDFINKNFKIINNFSTKIETFSKFQISNEKLLRFINKNIKNDNNYYYSILLPSNNENEIKILEINHEFKIINDYYKKLYLKNTDENNSENSSDEDEEYEKIKKSLVNSILIIKELNLLIISFESSTIAFYSLDYEYILHTKVFHNKIEPIININYFIFENNYYLIICLFSTDLIIYKIDEKKIREKKELFKYKILKNVCSELKPGISCIDFGSFEKEDLLSDNIEKNNILFIGGYDKRVKFYSLKNINEDNVEFKDLGNIITQGSGIINQIKFLCYEENFYLFICNEQKLFYIYNI